jgi:hypothetical protein
MLITLLLILLAINVLAHWKQWLSLILNSLWLRIAQPTKHTVCSQANAPAHSTLPTAHNVHTSDPPHTNKSTSARTHPLSLTKIEFSCISRQFLVRQVSSSTPVSI